MATQLWLIPLFPLLGFVLNLLLGRTLGRTFTTLVGPLAVLAAGDHNGSTFYQHQRFNAAMRGEGAVDVSLRDGLIAVVMGLAAQESAATGQAIRLTEGAFNVQALLG